MPDVPSRRTAVCAIPRIAATCAVGTALAVLVGWAANQALLRSIIPGAVEMKVNTALGLLTSGVVLWILAGNVDDYRRRFATAAAALLALLGIATLVEYSFGINLGIDEALFKDDATAYNLHRGRMSPYTAVAFIALATAFLTLHAQRMRWLGRAGLILALTIGVTSALGYLWDAQELVTDQLAPPVAINTAVVMILLAFGILVTDIAPTYLHQLEHGEKSAETTIVLALVLVFVLVGVGSSYTYRTTAHLEASLAADERLEQFRTLELELDRDLVDALELQRIYLTSDTVSHARDYAQALRKAEAQLQALKVLANDRRVNVALVPHIEASTNAYLMQLRQEVDLYRTGTSSLQQILERSPAHAMYKERMSLDEPIEHQYAETQAVRRNDARKLRQFTLLTILMRLALVAGVAALIVAAVRRDAERIAENRRYDELAQSILALLASTRARAQALDGSVRLLMELVPGSTVAFYAPAGNGDFDRESATDTHLWDSHFTAQDEHIAEVLRAGDIVQISSRGAAAKASNTVTPRLHHAFCPIAHGEQILGLLALRTLRALTPTECSFLRRKARHLAVTLTNLKHLSDLATLSEQLAHKNEVLLTQARELERATRLKSEFLATMSHELRTPLNAVIGFAEVLKDNLAGDLSADQREYVGHILVSGEHLLALINDILDLSKVEAGKMELDLEPVNLEALLGNALTMVRERALSRGIRLELMVDRQLPEVQADVRKLKQICYNLLSNAVKFSHNGGEVLVTATRRMRDSVAWLDISVSDTGIGISEANQARLFQPFVQADASLSKHYEGTGLGLALVKRLAELHGGCVAVQSTLQIGSTFTVSLPIECGQGAVPQMAAIAPPRSPVPAQALALVIEDQDRDAELLRLQLERSGFAVIREVDVQRGLAAARTHKPDIITIDVLLKGTDGWHVLEQLKSDAELAAIPIVVVSIAADRKKGLSLGAVAVLQKPIDRREIEALCATLTLTRRARQPCHVLVVDDDAMAGQIIGTYFESVGCTVSWVSSGRNAIEQTRAEMPDLVVLDLMMPDISGFDVLEALRSDEQTASIRVVVVTAKPLSVGERSALEQDTLAVLEKGSLRRVDLLRHVPQVVQEA